jgi:2-amino-4-hydroxy-6-hydroxymethyldihydropteridine diphosphokinase
MTLACIALGSNLGDSLTTLKQAVDTFHQSDQIQLDKCSPCYLSKPWGVEDQPDFYNAVVGIQTELSAWKLLDQLQQIELQFGRERNLHWGPRTLDLDIICYGSLEQDEPRLKLPHPFFAERDFVLLPLVDIYPDLIISGIPAADWLDRYLGKNPQRGLPEKLGVSLF